ncbi:UDP-3-O-(3-hydroxymyristoyl)glucosamine N-acyltransferase [Candidatus Saganbacteria bacterium]|nr:UDP-3-O-(3-hydroxymyristoyl)glucosamine N-acyltransferase [Candidatus Saganbacteria bacterium]
MTLAELAALVGGEVQGDPQAKIDGIATLEGAKNGDLVFVLEKNNLSAALKSPASALVVIKGTDTGKKSAILVKNPRLALARILKEFTPPLFKVEPGVHPTAVIDNTAKLGKDVSVGALSYIGPEVIIGDESIIHPQVTLYPGVKLGKRVIIHSGARIGVDGYGFAPAGNIHEKIPQIGSVVIGDDVEIYANTCIARGTIGDTVIGRGAKIDNLTHIAHNCVIGEDCAITALVGFAGSVTFGNHVTVGGQAGFNGHITVGENTVVMAKSGVTKDIPANSVISGFPAIDHKVDLKYQAALRKLLETK